MSVLITVDDLAAALAGPTPPVVLDVRWTLGGPPGHGEYLGGHLPGAVYVDLDTELAGHGEPTDGRHPLPDVDDLERAARRKEAGRGVRRIWAPQPESATPIPPSDFEAGPSTPQRDPKGVVAPLIRAR